MHGVSMMHSIRAMMAKTTVVLCLLLSFTAQGAEPAGHASGSFVRLFTVGGTVTGLLGSGLTLGDRGAIVPIGGNGSFSLPKLITTNGQKYDVTVVQQPGSPAQLCTVTNGSGTVNGADVNNILVACVAQALSLTSSVPATGSTGVSRAAPMTLNFSAALNAGTVTASTVVLTGPTGSQFPIAVSVSGAQLSVAPTRKLAPFAAYTLSVTTGLRGAGGETLGAPVSVGFTTIDADWQMALRIGSDIGASRDVAVATDGNANALAIWSLQPSVSAGPSLINFNRFTAGSGWSSAAQVGNGGDTTAFRPKVAFDVNGNAFAVWHQFDFAVNHFNILASHYTANAGWDSPVALQSAGVQESVEPQIGVDAQGNALAVWTQSDGIRSRIVSSRFIAGVGWTTSRPVDLGAGSATTGDALDPQIALDARGNALVLWRQFEPSLNRCGVWSNRYTGASDTWGTPVQIGTSDNLEDPDRMPRLLIDTNGNGLAVWRDAVVGVWSNRFAAGGGWQSAELIGNGSVDHPDLAIDARGNAVAVWSQSAGTQQFIWSNRFTSGSGWGMAAQIESVAGGIASRPKVGLDANGAGLVLWQQREGAITALNIWAMRFSTSRFGVPQRISNGAGAAGSQEITFDVNGDALAVWEQSDAADNTSTWANRFE